MKSFIIILSVFAVCMLTLPLTSDAAYMGNFMNGEKYMQLDETSRSMMVIGLYDMMSYEWDQPIYRDAADGGTRTYMSRVKRCLAQKTPGQIRAMLDQYLTNKPEAKKYNIASNFGAMLNTMCPY